MSTSSQPALQDVGVRVLLERDHHVGVVHHRGREVVVRVELGADHDVGPDDRRARAAAGRLRSRRSRRPPSRRAGRAAPCRPAAPRAGRRASPRAAFRTRARVVVPLGCAPATMPSTQRPALGLAARCARPTAGRRSTASARRGAGRPGSSRGRWNDAIPVGIGREGVGFGGKGGAEDTHGGSLVGGGCVVGVGQPAWARAGAPAPALSAVSPKPAMRCGSGRPRASAAQASPMAGRGLDAVAALRRDPEEAGRVGIEAADQVAVGDEGAQPGPGARGAPDRSAWSSPRCGGWRSAMSSSSGCTSCGSTGSALAGEPSSMPASGLMYQLSSTPTTMRPVRARPRPRAARR